MITAIYIIFALADFFIAADKYSSGRLRVAAGVAGALILLAAVYINLEEK